MLQTTAKPAISQSLTCFVCTGAGGASGGTKGPGVHHAGAALCIMSRDSDLLQDRSKLSRIYYGRGPR